MPQVDPHADRSKVVLKEPPIDDRIIARDPLPYGVRWAEVVGEPANRLMKSVRFLDDQQTGVAYVSFRDNARCGERMLGRILALRRNDDKLQGGWVVWRG